MRHGLRILAAFFLLASLVGGAVVHAAETAGGREVNGATQWLHSDGDHDQVPADRDAAYPHHHTICHGHDLAAPVHLAAAQMHSDEAGMLRLVAAAAPNRGPPASLLRPPIA